MLSWGCRNDHNELPNDTLVEPNDNYDNFDN